MTPDQEYFTEKLMKDDHFVWYMARKAMASLCGKRSGKRVLQYHTLEDISQEIWCILLKARRTYIRSKGEPSTYAYLAIMRDVQRLVSEGLIKLPRLRSKIKSTRTKAYKALELPLPFHTKHHGEVKKREIDWEAIDQQMDMPTFLQRVDDYMWHIPPRERMIILMRFSGFTFAEIGKMYGLTREGIRQLEVNVIRKLKNRITDRDRVTYLGEAM